MLVLGIDPGTIVAGYGLVRLHEGRRVEHIDSGRIHTGKGTMHQRLWHLHQALQEVMQPYAIDHGVIETSFVAKNPSVALKLGQARGVIMLTLLQAGLPIAEYAPREVKNSVVGQGSATKDMVAYMVAKRLGLPTPPAADAADALALALTFIALQSPYNKVRI